MSNKEIFSHSRDILRLDKILNVYQLTKLRFTTLMHRVQNQTIPRLFVSKFHKLQHKNLTNCSKFNHQIPTTN